MVGDVVVGSEVAGAMDGDWVLVVAKGKPVGALVVVSTTTIPPRVALASLGLVTVPLVAINNTTTS